MHSSLTCIMLTDSDQQFGPSISSSATPLHPMWAINSRQLCVDCCGRAGPGFAALSDCWLRVGGLCMSHWADGGSRGGWRLPIHVWVGIGCHADGAGPCWVAILGCVGLAGRADAAVGQLAQVASHGRCMPRGLWRVLQLPSLQGHPSGPSCQCMLLEEGRPVL